MSRLQELAELCKCTLHIEFNPHKGYYEELQSYVENIGDGDEWVNLSKGTQEGILRTDNLIQIQAYPRTPVAFVLIFHYDLEQAIELAIESIKEGWPDVPVSG